MNPAAEKAVQSITTIKKWTSIVGGIIACLMIFFGYFLTQRQLEIQHSEEMTELEINFAKEEFKLKSTYPGLVFIVCGTFVGVIVLGKGFYFITKQTNKQDGTPGYLEIKA